jgi:glycerol kinase
MHYLLAIDQGTTNSRAIIFDQQSKLISLHEMPLAQCYPHPGWVEQNPQEMIDNTILCCQEAMKKANIDSHGIAGIGISNQRETTIIWDKTTGRPIYPAIIWQDRRTAELCRELANTKIAAQIPEKTGLLLDPYFSATKIIWLLDHVEGASEQSRGIYYLVR